MKREDAIRNIAIALGIGFKDVEREIERQSESIKQLGEDMDRLNEVFRNIYSHVTPSIRKPKYPTSPYAKFDKYHKKKRR